MHSNLTKALDAVLLAPILEVAVGEVKTLILGASSCSSRHCPHVWVLSGSNVNKGVPTFRSEGLVLYL